MSDGDLLLRRGDEDLRSRSAFEALPEEIDRNRAEPPRLAIVTVASCAFSLVADEFVRVNVAGLMGGAEGEGLTPGWPAGGLGGSLLAVAVGAAPIQGDVMVAEWVPRRWVIRPPACRPLLKVVAINDQVVPEVFISGADVEVKRLRDNAVIATGVTDAQGSARFRLNAVDETPADPTAAATVDPAGGGAQGGVLEPRTYRVTYAWKNSVVTCQAPLSHAFQVGCPDPVAYPIPPLRAENPRPGRTRSNLKAGVYQLAYSWTQ